VSTILAVAVLLTTRTGSLPRLEVTYCTAGAVVIAEVERIVEDKNSSDPQFVELRVLDAFKGPVPVASCFRIKGHGGYRVGQVSFLFVKDEEALRSDKQQAWAFDCGGGRRLPILSQMFTEMAVGERDVVELDPSYFVLPQEIVSPEESQAKRQAGRTVPISKDRLTEVFRQLDAGGCDAQK
jgi:hypothetical protein